MKKSAAPIDAARAPGRAAGRVRRSLALAAQALDRDLLLHLAQMPVIGLTMLAGGGARAALAAMEPDGRRPVLLVHGLGGGPGNFLPMRAYLRSRGRARTIAVAADGEGLDEMAARLRDLVDDVVAHVSCPDGRVDLVGHSMGGLVCRLAISDKDTAARVGTLVTLGTPHAGTHLARAVPAQMFRDLRPDSDVIARLRAELPWTADRPRLVAFWSDRDLFVVPAKAACVPGAENVRMKGFTHYSYLIHPRGWRGVLAALDDV